MNLPSILRRRQIQAGLRKRAAKGFSSAFVARNDACTKLYRDLVLFFGTAFRNPSPWRQSGASMHLLPPFFFGAFAKRNFERDLLCQKQQRFSRLWRFLVPSQLVSALSHKFKTLQAAPLLVRQQQRLLAATQTKLLQAASLVPQPARWLAHNLTPTHTLCRIRVADVNNKSERHFAPTGRVAFSCF